MKIGNTSEGQKGFTLLELILVVGILSVMAATAVVIINPVEYFKQSRDVRRIGDIRAMSNALDTAIANSPNIAQGTAQKVYISIPDTATNCPNVTATLPTLPTGWSYYCATAANSKKTDGTGWIPINFDAISVKSPLTTLPVDPVNDATKGLWYGYVANAGFTAVLESQKQATEVGAKDGGIDSYRFETGRDIVDLPAISLATVPAIDPASVKILIVEYQDCGQNLTAQLASLGFTNVVTDTTVTTVAQVDAYKPNIVAASKGCWGVTKTALLNQLYASGYDIYTQGNDTDVPLTPIASAVSVTAGTASGTIAPLGRHAINTGWATTANSGTDGRRGLTANAKAIVLGKDGTLGYDEIIYLEEGGKGKWGHTQPSGAPNGTLLKNMLLYLAR